jgi:hypothetical protein
LQAKPESDLGLEGVYLVGILILGFVYWLLAKVEDRKGGSL